MCAIVLHSNRTETFPGILCVLDVGGRLELPSKTKGSSRRRRAGVVKLTRFCTPFSVTRMAVGHFLPLVDLVWSPV